MKLNEVLAKAFSEELEKVGKKEIDEKDYLPQEDFESCMERAQAMIFDALPRVENMLALAIAIHRHDAHGEDTVEEVKITSEALAVEDVEAVSANIWWRG